MAIATVNPATGETLKTYEPITDEVLEEKIARAAAAWASYRRTSPEERAGWLRAAADVLDGDAKMVAELMTTEMGKTLASAKAEVAKCAKGLRWYADNGPALLGQDRRDAGAVGAVDAYVEYQPIGVVLAIMPWNFPLWQAMRFAAPALMAGNVGLLKHASNVPQTALYLEELFRKAGFPADVFQTLLIGSATVEKVLRDDRVAAATRSSDRTSSTCFVSMSIVWKTSAGKPARRNSSSMYNAVCGTFDACLSSPTLPAISAGAAKRIACQSGKFHGMIARTTPSGWYSTNASCAPTASAS